MTEKQSEDFEPTEEEVPLISEKMSSEKIFSVSRQAYSQKQFDDKFNPKYDERKWKDILKDKVKRIRFIRCTKKDVANVITGKVPVIKTFMKYDWRDWFFADLIAGLIIGIIHIPQGMAYAQLATLKPLYGLYTSIFPAFIYFLLGTSNHISIGTMAISSLMTGQYIETSLMRIPDLFNATNINDLNEMEELQVLMAQKAAGLSLFVGVTQLIMGLLNMGSLIKYMPDPVIIGFTVGASVHVLTSQIKFCFGVKIPTFHGPFKIVKTYASIGMKLTETNIITFIISVLSMFVLAFTKSVINPIIVKKIKYPIPIELLVVISGILTSKYLFLNERHKVAIVGKIAKNLPVPSVPNFEGIQHAPADVIITAIISFVISASLAKIFSNIHAYKINSNQEFIAYGMMNMFGSFFSCFPSAASLSRSAAQESVGGKTQLTSIVSSIFIILILLFISPHFEKLPKCILASIIIVALKGLFNQCTELSELWSFCFWDFNIWIVTFISTVIIDVEYGLIIGISLSIVSIMLRTQNPRSQILGQIPGTEIYRDASIYECVELPGIKIFQYGGPVYYASSDNFKESLYKKVNFDPKEVYFSISQVKKEIHKIQKRLEKKPGEVDLLKKQVTLNTKLKNLTIRNIAFIIIDCSAFDYIDIVGAKALNEVIEEYKIMNISVVLANLNNDVRQMLNRTEPPVLINDDSIYVTIHDAVISHMYQETTK